MNLQDIIGSYDPQLSLDRASTIPSSWYTDKDLYDLELKSVFSNSWQLAARLDQLTQPGQYVTTEGTSGFSNGNVHETIAAHQELAPA